MSRRDRMSDEESPARRREARAKKAKQDIADELRRLADEEYKRRQAKDLEDARERVEGSKDPYLALLKASKVAPDSLLGANRRKRPGIQGRPPYA